MEIIKGNHRLRGFLMTLKLIVLMRDFVVKIGEIRTFACLHSHVVGGCQHYHPADVSIFSNHVWLRRKTSEQLLWQWFQLSQRGL
jgi:hypothetical protein